MTYSKELISLIFPNDLLSPEALEAQYPKRDIPHGAIVTRFAPSPTGFIHIGGVYIAVLGKDLTFHSNGVFFIRIEDTDQKRKVDDSKTQFNTTFKYFGIESDENDSNSIYGPFTQSKRANIYLAYVKKLMEKNRAYPCFCTKEMLEEQTNEQKEAKVDLGYYGKWAKCSRLSEQQIKQKIDAGEPYVIRFRCNGDDNTVEFEDKIKGTIGLKNNINDIVILKSSSEETRLPTYHLAHPIDDHLMGVNLVLRADEWLPSVPLHFQLFDALEFERLPYAHIAPIMKLDGSSKRKLSKRKDPEASVGYYMENGYPSKAVTAYLKSLANSRLLDATIDECLSAQIMLDEMPKAGALLDITKLNHISSNYIATLTNKEIGLELKKWALAYDMDLYNVIEKDFDYVCSAIDTDRINDGKIRKDLSKWSDYKKVFGYFHNELFNYLEITDERFENISIETIKQVLGDFALHYAENLENDSWMEVLQTVAKNAGFAINNQEYKKEPEKFKGKLSDAIKIIRIALTGSANGLNLHEVCKTIGSIEIKNRISHVIK